MERRVTKTPIHIEFGAHNTESIHTLYRFGERVQGYLENSSKGVVATYIEAADNEFMVNRESSGFSKQGFIPSAAFMMAVGADLYKDRTRKIDEERLSKIFYSGSEPFGAAQMQWIDILAEAYPNRVQLFLEGFQGNDVYYGRHYSEHDSIVYTSDLVNEGRFNEALPIYKEAIEELGVSLASRDQSIAKELMEIAEQPAVCGIVSRFGSAHTGFYHILKRGRYNVTRSFADTEGVKNIYLPPNAAATRAVAFFPEKQFSKDQWLKWIFLSHSQKEVNHILRLTYIKRTGSDNGYDSYPSVVYTWGLFGNLSVEAIRTFEVASKKEGFPLVVYDFFSRIMNSTK